MVRALGILEQQSSCKTLQDAIVKARHTIQDGGTITEAMRQSPNVFNTIYTSLISAGERTGTLEHSLETICKNLETTRLLRTRMMTAAMYPLIVITTLIVITLVLLIFVIPTFEELYAESHAELPWLTRAVLTLSNTLLGYWHLWLIVILFSCVAAVYSARSVGRKRHLRAILERMPIARSFTRRKNASQWAGLLSSLIRAGIPILEGLAITRDTMGSSEAALHIERMRERLLEGYSLSQSLGENTVFPTLVSHMVAIGEETGQLESMLSKTASFYEQELEASIEKLKQAAEPCLVLMIGAIVGTLVLAMYLPIFQLGEVAQIR